MEIYQSSPCYKLSSFVDSVPSKKTRHTNYDNMTSTNINSLASPQNVHIKSIFPTPPSTPPTAQPTWDDLPRQIAIAILASGVLRLEDRLHLMLVSRKVHAMVSDAEQLATSLRICVTENEDDRVSSAFILRRLRRYTNLRSVTLLLSSTVHSNLCKTNQLLLTLAHNCKQLRELTLLLAQMRVKYLNDGLTFLGTQTKLRKLSLVNSAANDTTCAVIAEAFPDLESVGLLNCWQVSELGVMSIIDRCSALTTLNVRHCKNVTNGAVQYLITVAHNRAKENPDASRRRVRVYAAHTAVQPEQLDLMQTGAVVLTRDPTRPMEQLLPGASRKRKGGCDYRIDLDEQAKRHDWEYNSDSDF